MSAADTGPCQRSARSCRPRTGARPAPRRLRRACSSCASPMSSSGMSQTERAYPASLAIEPLTRPPAMQICVPGSKSITNRALVLAALQSHEHNCVLRGALCSEDTEVMVDGLRALGFLIDARWPVVHISRHGGKRLVPAAAADIFVA